MTISEPIRVLQIETTHDGIRTVEDVTTEHTATMLALGWRRVDPFGMSFKVFRGNACEAHRGKFGDGGDYGCKHCYEASGKPGAGSGFAERLILGLPNAKERREAKRAASPPLDLQAAEDARVDNSGDPIHSPDPETHEEDAVEQVEDLFTPAFGPPVGTVGHFSPHHPGLEQRVEINEATESECCAHDHFASTPPCPARYFMLSGWPDALPLCEACMPRDIGAPRKSEPPTNAENAAPTEPPPGWEPRPETIAAMANAPFLDPDDSLGDAADAAEGRRWLDEQKAKRERQKASKFIRALADEMVPPLKSGTYAELERHDHKRMRAELEAIIRYLDEER